LVGNRIDDSLCESLSEVLIKSLPPLRDLNLSRNNICDRGACAIADFIQVNHHIKTIKISWNKIQGRGGIAIANAIKDCQRLVFLDCSFNMLGSKHNGVFGLKIGEACNKGYLKHLDISYNSLDKNECEIFGKTI
jgi:Ran GTPase-activating protein (RanGAP) involved in mRNA processing and transport